MVEECRPVRRAHVRLPLPPPCPINHAGLDARPTGPEVDLSALHLPCDLRYRRRGPARWRGQLTRVYSLLLSIRAATAVATSPTRQGGKVFKAGLSGLTRIRPGQLPPCCSTALFTFPE